MLWGFIYVGVFILVFATSAIIKMTYNPLSGEMQVHWNDTVGHVYSDIAYDDKEQNKFDLYVPADNTKKSYGLVVYLHAGGFSTGDKSDDANMLKWLTSKVMSPLVLIIRCVMKIIPKPVYILCHRKSKKYSSCKSGSGKVRLQSR